MSYSMTAIINEPPECININCERKVCYSHTHKSGTKRWRPICSRCHQASYGKIKLDEGIIAVKKTYCENRDGRFGYECKAHIPYPGVLELDHIDGNRSNNNIDNLHFVSATGNQKNDNRKLNRNNTSGIKGLGLVTINGRTYWLAQHYVNRKQVRKTSKDKQVCIDWLTESRKNDSQYINFK